MPTSLKVDGATSRRQATGGGGEAEERREMDRGANMPLIIQLPALNFARPEHLATELCDGDHVSRNIDAHVPVHRNSRSALSLAHFRPRIPMAAKPTYMSRLRGLSRPCLRSSLSCPIVLARTEPSIF